MVGSFWYIEDTRVARKAAGVDFRTDLSPPAGRFLQAWTDATRKYRPLVMPALSSLWTEVYFIAQAKEPDVRYIPRSSLSPPLVEDASTLANRTSLGSIQDAKGKKNMVCVIVAGSRR